VGAGREGRDFFGGFVFRVTEMVVPYREWREGAERAMSRRILSSACRSLWRFSVGC
jgi:hypothetical protein